MNYDDQLCEFVSTLNKSNCIENSDFGADFLSNTFSFIGSKVDLSIEKNYKTAFLETDNFESVYSFFSMNKTIRKKILSSEKIYYVGDNLTNVDVEISSNDFFIFLEFVVTNIPEHHYFFSVENKWCLLIATEGYIEFGEKFSS